MGINIPLQTRRAKAQALREAAESWKAEHDEAMAAYALQDLVGQCLDAPADLRAVWDSMMAAAEAEVVDDYEAAGTSLFAVCDHILGAIEQIHELASGFAARTGHTIAGLDRLAQVIVEAKGLRDAYRRTWPREGDPWPAIDPARIDAGLAAYRRGEYQTFEEAVREAQGRHPA